MKKITLLSFLIAFSFLPVFAFAATGTIVDGYQQSTLLDQDLDTDGFDDVINWKPTNGTPVSITDSAVTGNIWGETIGWINLSPSEGGVVNDGEGILSGWAWGQNTSWINFNSIVNCDQDNNGFIDVACDGDNTTDVIVDFKVSIDTTTGEFEGYAWSQNYGWIKFECPGSDTASDSDSYADTCVKTDWVPDDEEEDEGGCVDGTCPEGTPPLKQCEDGKDNDGDGLIDFPRDPGCLTPDYNDEYNDSSDIPVYICSDGIDNDGDGLTDHPSDSGCFNVFDQSEYNSPIDQECTDPNCEPTDPTCEELGNCSDNDECTGNDCEDDNECVGSDCPPPPDDEDCTGGNCGGLIDRITKFKPPEWGRLILSGRETLEDFVETLKGDVAVKTIGLLGVAAALISVPISLWRSILALLGYRNRKKWGIVFDSVTKQPLDPVYVVLQDVFGNEVATSITDLDGRYGFLVGPGRYKIVANKNNYTFPSVKLAGKINDEVYQDLYFGEEIVVTTEGEVILKNIPLDSMTDDWNERVKKEQGLMKFYSSHDIWFYRIATTLFYAGFAVSVVALVIDQSAINIGIVALYAVLFVLRKTVLKPKAKGSITYKANGAPVAFPLVSIFAVGSNRLVTKKVADAHGNYYALVPKGNYYVGIDIKNADGSYTRVLQSPPMEVKGGIINKMFEI